MTGPSETAVLGAIAVTSVFVGLAVAFGGPQVNLVAGVVWTVATGMVFLRLRGKARDARSDESPEPEPLLRLAEIDYDPRHDRHLGVLLFALGITASAALLVVDPSGWDALFLVDVGNCCLIVALGTVALSDR